MSNFQFAWNNWRHKSSIICDDVTHSCLARCWLSCKCVGDSIQTLQETPLLLSIFNFFICEICTFLYHLSEYCSAYVIAVCFNFKHRFRHNKLQIRPAPSKLIGRHDKQKNNNRLTIETPTWLICSTLAFIEATSCSIGSLWKHICLWLSGKALLTSAAAADNCNLWCSCCFWQMLSCKLSWSCFWYCCSCNCWDFKCSNSFSICK